MTRQVEKKAAKIEHLIMRHIQGFMEVDNKTETILLEIITHSREFIKEGSFNCELHRLLLPMDPFHGHSSAGPTEEAMETIRGGPATSSFYCLISLVVKDQPLPMGTASFSEKAS